MWRVFKTCFFKPTQKNELWYMYPDCLIGLFVQQDKIYLIFFREQNGCYVFVSLRNYINFTCTNSIIDSKYPTFPGFYCVKICINIFLAFHFREIRYNIHAHRTVNINSKLLAFFKLFADFLRKDNFTKFKLYYIHLNFLILSTYSIFTTN